ncbi:OmpA family protein [Chitinophaga alhagiae]|uniref:OmpA family protein n=1 Tax=Chitinophaga alhagiae TaxID=2203219 RepID=UPI0018E5A5A3|nr:OmpA family protein [Chitinophaga alhagiae]
MQAQNLVANPSFEDVNICTEFNAPCAPAAWESVSPESAKLDYMFHQYSGGAGNNLVRLVHRSQDALRNYAQTRLLCPLEKGRSYRVTLVGWQDGDAPPAIELRFDTTWTFRETGGQLTDLQPGLQLDSASVAATGNKKRVFTLQKEFIAGDHYTHLVLGTFRKRPWSAAKICNYIDSIAITPVSGGPLCVTAAGQKDSLYNQHRRHSIPSRFYQHHEARRRHLLEGPLKCITVRVKDHTIFTAAGRAQNPEAAARIDSAVRIYEPATGMKVRITGHSFREGSFNYNKIVGEVNAKKVMDVLIYMKGFSFEDITVDSRGNTQPAYDTATAEGRERNNFVELEFCMPRSPEEATVAAAPPVQRPDTLVVPDVLFLFNSDVLNTKLHRELDKLLKKIPVGQPVQLQVIGHTDNRGEEDYNLELSKRRALAVAAYLKLQGWGNYIRHVAGEGEKRPAASNETMEGRQLNRRVEIIVYQGLD